MPRILLLVGPPSSSGARSWTEHELCIEKFLPPYEIFLLKPGRLQEGAGHSREEQSHPSRGRDMSGIDVQDPPKWRLLNPRLLHLPTGLSQADWVRSPYIGNFVESDRISASNSQPNKGRCSTDANTDHELLHENVVKLEDNRQSIKTKTEEDATLYDDLSTTSSVGESISSLYSGIDDEISCRDSTINTHTGEGVRNGIAVGPITNLSCLPNARHVSQSYPQTLTANLVVTVLAVGPLQNVVLRRTGQPATVAECRVADETEENFIIKLWGRPKESGLDASKLDQEGQLSDLYSTVNSLLTGEIVIFRHVALASWKGMVYGQSLKVRRQTRSQPRPHWEALTTLNRVRIETDGSICGFSEAVKSKIQCVMRWSRAYVANEYLRTPIQQSVALAKNTREMLEALSSSSDFCNEEGMFPVVSEDMGLEVFTQKDKNVDRAHRDRVGKGKVIDLPIDDTPR